MYLFQCSLIKIIEGHNLENKTDNVEEHTFELENYLVTLSFKLLVCPWFFKRS